MTRPTMLVASSGGHLTQLVDLAERITDVDPAVWITFDSDQARSALAGREVEFVRYVEPRGYASLVRSLPSATRILRRFRPSRVVSTGSGIALAYLPLARLVGADAFYIESATRAEGPSQTGRLLSRVPGVELRTQHPHLADGDWKYVGSVFDGFEAVAAPTRRLERVVVTVGTMETYGFRRLVEKLAAVLPGEAEVLWQTGVTNLDRLTVTGRHSVPAAELEAAISAADLVVAHAGTGSALTALRLGRRPLLIPRCAAHGEHIDDHQQQTATHLADLGLATVLSVEELTVERLKEATAGAISRNRTPPALELRPSASAGV